MKSLALAFLIQAIPNGFYWPSLPWGDGVLWVGPVPGQFDPRNPTEYAVVANLLGIVDEWNSVFWTGYQTEPLSYQAGMDSASLHIPVMKDYSMSRPGQTHEIPAGQDPASGFQIFAQAVVYLNPTKLAWHTPIPDSMVDGKTAIRHELGHALGLGDDFQCHGLLMCTHYRERGPFPIDADAMRGIYCLYGWPGNLPDSVEQYAIFKILPNTARGNDVCSPWFIYVQGCAGGPGCSQTTLQGWMSLTPRDSLVIPLVFLSSRYAQNRCMWVAAWWPQPGDPGVREKNGYLYPNSHYRVTVLSPDAPPGAWDGYRSSTVNFNGGYPVQCGLNKRSVQEIALAGGRCGYRGGVTLERIPGGFVVKGLAGGGEVMLVDPAGRLVAREKIRESGVVRWKGALRRGFVIVQEEGGKRQVFPVWR